MMEVGDTVEVTRTVVYVRRITEVNSHAGGTDVTYDRPLPPPGGQVIQYFTKQVNRKKGKKHGPR